MNEIEELYNEINNAIAKCDKCEDCEFYCDKGDCQNKRIAKALINAGYHKTEVKTNGDYVRSISLTITDEQFADDNVEVVTSIEGKELFIARLVGEVFSTKNEAYQANLEWLRQEYRG